MKAAFQIKNILDITDPESDDRLAALDAFQDIMVGVLPDDSPITVYDRQVLSKATRPGKAMFFSDDSVLLIVTYDDKESIMQAIDAATPEGFFTLAEALKATEIGSELQDAAAALRDALGDDADLVEYIETENGKLKRV